MSDDLILPPELARQRARADAEIEKQTVLRRLEAAFVAAEIEPHPKNLICMVWLGAFNLAGMGYDKTKLMGAIEDAFQYAARSATAPGSKES